MMSSILDTISSPEDLKNLPFEELEPLCTERRQGDIWPPIWGRWS